VPVEVTSVVTRSISSYIETNGILEAENEVDIVARTSGPIVELDVEETERVKAGQRLARIDREPLEAQLELSRVALNEAKLAYDRVQKLIAEELISVEEYDAAVARYESAKAQYEGNLIELDYTDIVAPFDGLIVERYIKFAEHVSVGTPLFRIADFDPLLCPIQVPERELASLRKDQFAYLTVEAWPGERFDARVLRISPVVDAATGTIKVTLQVDTLKKLRPGMFASVFVETAVHENVRVIPKSALSLDSIGDTVFVTDGETASRRSVKLGVQEGDFVEILDGVEAGEQVVVVGQDGLSDGTPVQILQAISPSSEAVASGSMGPSDSGSRVGEPSGAGEPRAGGSAPAGERRAGAGGQGGPGGAMRPEGGRGGPGSKRPRFDPSTMTAEQLEQVKERMRSRGMTEEQIEARLQQAARDNQKGGAR
jgi:membrane fusion protein (multidrug efflux system)